MKIQDYLFTVFKSSDRFFARGKFIPPPGVEVFRWTEFFCDIDKVDNWKPSTWTLSDDKPFTEGMTPEQIKEADDWFTSEINKLK